MLAAAAGIIAILVSIAVRQRNSALEQESEELVAVASLKQAELRTWLAERQADGAVLGRLRPLAEEHPDPHEADALLGAMVEQYGYLCAAVLGADRTPLAVSPPERADCVKGYLAGCGPLPREGNGFLPMAKIGDGSTRAFGLAGRFEARGPSAPDRFYLLLIDPARYLDPLLGAWPLPSASGEVLLVRPEGDRVVFLNEVRHRAGTALAMSHSIADPELPAARGARGDPGPMEGRDYRGVPVLAAMRPIPRTGWVLVAKVDRSEALAPTRGPRIATALLAAAVAGLAGLLLFLSHHRRMLDEARRRAEENARIRAMVEGSRDGVLVTDGDHRIRHVNRVALSMLGYSEAADVLGRRKLDLFPEPARTAIERAAEAVEKDGAAEVTECAALGADGRALRVELLLSRIRWDGQDYRLSTIRDVTRRHELEESLVREARLNRALLEVARIAADTRGPEAVAESVLEGLTELTGAGFGFVGFWNEDRSELVVPTFSRQIWKGRRIEGETPSFPRPRGLWGWVLREGKPLLTNDPAGDDRSNGVLAGHPPMESFLGVPALFEGEVLGMVALADAPGGFSERDLATAGHFALLYAESLHRAAEARVRERLSEEKAELQGQLAVSQRLEAVGRLAGGIAHDFNNVLTVIGGYAELIRKTSDGKTLARASEIRGAVARAGNLTRQLLAFSRRQILDPKVLDLNGVLYGMGNLLGRLIGEDIELRTFPASGLWAVSADPGQIEQILVNLAVNARDAMPEGGSLTLETGNVYLDESYVKHHVGAREGRHVMLSVSDTGTGMTAEVRERAFDPFYTTKEPGQGTGLGLATVYGIAKQSRGSIYLYSEVGRGTTFKIYLPAVDGDARPLEVTKDDVELSGGTETILLAEDDDSLRSYAYEILVSAGYQVLVASNGREAEEVEAAHAGEIDLLLTDVIMPIQGGPPTVDAIRTRRPDLRTLYISGYAPNAIHVGGYLKPGVQLLQKPFTAEDLLQRVRELLDR